MSGHDTNGLKYTPAHTYTHKSANVIGTSHLRLNSVQSIYTKRCTVPEVLIRFIVKLAFFLG
jgi:hypothetical protein